MRWLFALLARADGEESSPRGQYPGVRIGDAGAERPIECECLFHATGFAPVAPSEQKSILENVTPMLELEGRTVRREPAGWIYPDSGRPTGARGSSET